MSKVSRVSCPSATNDGRAAKRLAFRGEIDAVGNRSKILPCSLLCYFLLDEKHFPLAETGLGGDFDFPQG